MTHILLLLLSASSSNTLPTLQAVVSLLKPLRQTSHRNDFVNALKSHASEKPLLAAYSLPNFHVLRNHTWLVMQSNEVVLLLISWLQKFQIKTIKYYYESIRGHCRKFWATHFRFMDKRFKVFLLKMWWFKGY